MKILRVDNEAGISGTSLQGHFAASYDELVKVFGEPTKYEETGGYDKVWTEWSLEFEVQDEDDPDDSYYVKATIYDWKESSPYDSRSGQYRWHIGGNDWRAEDAIGTYFNQHVEEVA